MDFLAERLLIVVPLLLSLTVHEFAHAYAAFRLGDDTAARLGRLTLNPIPHIDPIGTLLLPMIGIPFGWAKPVPVDPSRFRREVSMSRGMMITAAAGPASNVALAIGSTVLWGLLLRFNPVLLAEQPALEALLSIMVQLNIVLAVFNMLPIPPLDGSRVVEGFLPFRMRPAWERFARMGPLLLLGVLFFGGTLIAGPVSAARAMLHSLVATVAGI